MLLRGERVVLGYIYIEYRNGCIVVERMVGFVYIGRILRGWICVCIFLCSCWMLWDREIYISTLVVYV